MYEKKPTTFIICLPSFFFVETPTTKNSRVQWWHLFWFRPAADCFCFPISFLLNKMGGMLHCLARYSSISSRTDIEKQAAHRERGRRQQWRHTHQRKNADLEREHIPDDSCRWMIQQCWCRSGNSLHFRQNTRYGLKWISARSSCIKTDFSFIRGELLTWNSSRIQWERSTQLDLFCFYVSLVSGSLVWLEQKYVQERNKPNQQLLSRSWSQSPFVGMRTLTGKFSVTLNTIWSKPVIVPRQVRLSKSRSYPSPQRQI